MKKTFHFRIYPNEIQKISLGKSFGCCRFLYNKALSHKIEQYKLSGKSDSYNTLATKFLQDLKEEFPWLKETHSQVLQSSLKNLDRAYQNFFKNHFGFPKFKKKYDHQSISFPQYVRINFNKSIVRIPKLGNISCVFHRIFKGIIKTCTISKSKTDKYFISILVEDGQELPKKIEPKSINEIIALDLGIKDYYTDSNGTKVDNPKFYDKHLKRLANLQRRLALKTKRSKNYKKLRLSLAKIHEKILFKRDDYLHKLSSTLVNKNQVIIVEDLNVKDMLENSNTSLSRNIQDASWSKFITFLTYKSEWRGKRLIKINRFDPSSKRCSKCGKIYNELTLKERNWKCSTCGTFHDRDENAAKNVLHFGLEQPEMKEILSGMEQIGYLVKNKKNALRLHQKEAPA
jgi:putative transposase